MPSLHTPKLDDWSDLCWLREVRGRSAQKQLMAMKQHLTRRFGAILGRIALVKPTELEEQLRECSRIRVIESRPAATFLLQSMQSGGRRISMLYLVWVVLVGI